MDNEVIDTIYSARVSLAKKNIDQLELIIQELPPEVLCGNVFDRQYIPITSDTISLILYSAKKRGGINRVFKEEIDALINLKKGLINKKERKKEFPRIKELKNIFESLESNIKLFDLKFDNKIHKLNINDQRRLLVSIETCSLFHLLGFDLNNWQNKYRDEILRILPELNNIMQSNYIDICSKDERILYDALHVILRKKDTIIDELSCGNIELIKAFNINKVKIKNFIFDKSDYTSSPSGVIKGINKDTMIKGDLFILRDFINWDEQDWSYFSFVNHRENPYRSSESLLFSFVPKDELNLRDLSYTTSVEVLDKKRFLIDNDENNVISKTTFSKHEIEYVKSKLYVRK